MRTLLPLVLSCSTLAHAQPDSAISSASPFDAPTWADRLQVFLKRRFGPQAILETVPGTALDTARGFPRKWGRGSAGIAKRLGSQYGQFVIGEGIETGASAMHREASRYLRLPDGHFGRRLGHALASTVVVRGGGGGPTIGLARLADVYGASAIATAWNPPDQRILTQIAKHETLGLSLNREFWPDVKRKLGGH